MNPLNAKDLALAYKLRYVDAEVIIRNAVANELKGMLSLTVLAAVCGIAGIVCLFVSQVPHDWKARLPLLIAIVVGMTQRWLAQRRARQPILDAAAARAKTQNS